MTSDNETCVCANTSSMGDCFLQGCPVCHRIVHDPPMNEAYPDLVMHAAIARDQLYISEVADFRRYVVMALVWIEEHPDAPIPRYPSGSPGLGIAFELARGFEQREMGAKA